MASFENFPISLEILLKQYRKFEHSELKKRGHDITGDQWQVLECLVSKADITQKNIAEATGKDPASLTRMIDLLENRGLVVRKNNPEDRRSALVNLTEKGAELAAEIDPLIKEMRVFALRKISDEDLTLLSTLISQIKENI